MSPGRVTHKSIGTELVPFAGGAITVHTLASGARVTSLWILAQVSGVEPAIVAAEVVLLPPALRSQVLRFVRDGAKPAAVPWPSWLAELARLDERQVPRAFRPIWRVARTSPVGAPRAPGVGR